MELLIEAPSPRLLGGVPELENNYFLRSTPRKLVGMLDQWDLPPEQLSQASVVRRVCSIVLNLKYICSIVLFVALYCL